MSILVRFTPVSSASPEQYDDVIRRLQADGREFPPEGLEYHFAFVEDGKLRVGEVWASRDKFEAFGSRLMPILASVGIEPGTPKIDEVHNTITG